MEPLTSCQYSAIFCSTKNSQSKMYTDVHFQNGHGCPGCQSAASFSLEKLVVEPCTRRYTAQQRHRIEAVSFLLRVWCSSSLRREEKRCGIFAEARKRYKRIAWFLRCFNIDCAISAVDVKASLRKRKHRILTGARKAHQCNRFQKLIFLKPVAF